MIAAPTGDGAALTGDGTCPGERSREGAGDGDLRRLRRGLGDGAGIGDAKADDGGVTNLVCAKG